MSLSNLELVQTASGGTMRPNFAVMATISVGATIPLCCSVLRAQHGSTVEGVYTEAQAARGLQIYGQSCSSCHGPALMGDDAAAPLTGGQFFSSWIDSAVGELAERIRTSMPANNPGSLSRQQTADVLAYILSFNKYPVGNTELPPQTESLNQIKIQPPQP